MSGHDLGMRPLFFGVDQKESPFFHDFLSVNNMTTTDFIQSPKQILLLKGLSSHCLSHLVPVGGYYQNWNLMYLFSPLNLTQGQKDRKRKSMAHFITWFLYLWQTVNHEALLFRKYHKSSLNNNSKICMSESVLSVNYRTSHFHITNSHYTSMRQPCLVYYILHYRPKKTEV